MRRKNRKWVAIAAGFYLFVMWSAWRWGVSQRPPDGNIFDHIEREAVRNLHEQQAREAEEKAKEAALPPATGEARLNAAGPAFVAARYDQTHVVFVVATDTESRFSSSPHRRYNAAPSKIPAASAPLAPLAGLHELWEPDSHSLHFFPAIVQKTQPGEQWLLSAGPSSTIPVVIDRAVVAPLGCTLALGFLASLPSAQPTELAASAPQYYVVRRAAVGSVDPPVNSHIAELTGWNLSAGAAKQIEQQLTARMQQDLASIDARLRANAGSPGATTDYSLANPHPNSKEWIHADQGLARGEGVLDYDIGAFRLTPDGQPRLFVRARWKLANAPVFLMTAWFKDSPNESQTQPPQLLSADSSWSLSLRQDEVSSSLGDTLDFATILNQFDADHDGWAELLIHSYQGPLTTIGLYLYTDLGLVPLKAPLTRDLRSPESCLDP